MTLNAVLARFFVRDAREYCERKLRFRRYRGGSEFDIGGYDDRLMID